MTSIFNFLKYAFIRLYKVSEPTSNAAVDKRCGVIILYLLRAEKGSSHCVPWIAPYHLVTLPAYLPLSFNFTESAIELLMTLIS